MLARGSGVSAWVGSSTAPASRRRWRNRQDGLACLRRAEGTRHLRHKAESVTRFPVAGRLQGKQREMLCLPRPLTFGVFVVGCCS